LRQLRRDISEAFHMALSGQLRHMKYLAKVHQFHVHVCFSGHLHVRVLSVSVSVSMCVSVSISISVLFQFKYGAMIIYGRHGNYIVDSLRGGAET
jgi:hypothetical protein